MERATGVPVNFKVKMYQNTRKNMRENQEQKCTTPPHSLAASTIFLFFINHCIPITPEQISHS